MAGLYGYAAPSPITLTSSTGPLTVLQIKAPANHRVIVKKINVSFNGNTASQVPVLVEVVRQSAAGTMSALTPVKEHEGDNEAIQATAQHTVTDIANEPTTGDVLWRDYVHVMSGLELPIKDIPIIGGQYLGVRVTTPALSGTVKMSPTIRFEE